MASEFLHWFTWLRVRRLELIWSRKTLLTLPNSLFAGLMNLQFGWFSKFSLWSLSDINACIFAMVCILLHMLCSFAMSSETRLNFFVSYSLKFVVMLFVSSLLYFCESISYKFLVFSAKTKTLDVDCIFLASLAGMLRNWSLTFRNSRFSIIFSISFRNLLILWCAEDYFSTSVQTCYWRLRCFR